MDQKGRMRLKRANRQMMTALIGVHNNRFDSIYLFYIHNIVKKRLIYRE